VFGTELAAAGIADRASRSASITQGRSSNIATSDERLDLIVFKEAVAVGLDRLLDTGIFEAA
jgi:hypothetical protein